MEKLRMDLDGLAVESFEAGQAVRSVGTVRAHDGCSMQPTCGIASRGPETYEQEAASRYACCV